MDELINTLHSLNLSNQSTAFKNADVITMDNENMLRDQIVVIKDGLIASLGDMGNTVIPDDTRIIDAKGKYLMPGLVDMHVHFNSFFPFFGIENEWALYIANGVTSVRNMWGVHIGAYHPFLKKSKKIDMSKIPFPNVYTGGNILESKPKFFPSLSKVIDKPQEAFKIIDAEKEKGYEFVKIYHTLSEEAYKAVAAASKESGIRFLGHVPDKVGIEGAVKEGQHSMEHLTGFFNPFTGKPILDNKTIREYAKMTAAAGVWNCPTMVVWQRYLSPEKEDEFSNKSEMKYLPEKLKITWKKGLDAGSKKLNKYENYNEYLKTVVEKLHEAGAGILLGTDAHNPFVIPGFSIHEELDNLVKAGLSPFEAIKTGTKNAAMCLSRVNEFGTVSVGKRGDLILLDKNPMTNINNLKSIAGVMVRGTWIPKTALDALLGSIANSN